MPLSAWTRVGISCLWSPWSWKRTRSASSQRAKRRGVILRIILPLLNITVYSEAGAIAFGLTVGLSAVLVGTLSAVLVQRHFLPDILALVPPRESLTSQCRICGKHIALSQFPSHMQMHDTEQTQDAQPVEIGVVPQGIKASEPTPQYSICGKRIILSQFVAHMEAHKQSRENASDRQPGPDSH